jgi:hypothetical protein
MTITSDLITELVETKVEEILASEGDVLLSEAAADVVADARQTDADALIDWFSDHAINLIRTQLQSRLAMARRGTRIGVFQEREVKPFERRYATADNVWKRIGEMRRPDWRFLVEQRSKLATASLFDIALAKRLIKRLPDDTTPTHEVVSEAELRSLEDQAQVAAERSVAKFA